MYFLGHWAIISDQSENFLNWKQRRSIAIGTAKGLRFLHEECRGSPIIHRDLRPSNILLTHDFVPMVILDTVLLIVLLFDYLPSDVAHICYLLHFWFWIRLV